MSKKVLVIDDDESILDAISLILQEEGYTVETIFKGDEAYQKIYDFKPDVILLDVLMSGNDGRHICKNIKSNPLTKHIPVIMISAHPTAKQSSLACGSDDFLAKPFETAELLQKVKEYSN